MGSLAKFTGVTFAANPAETLLTDRNVQCIRTLLELALTDGNALGSSWKAVLECVSRLHRLEMASSGCTDDVILPQPTPGVGSMETAEKHEPSERPAPAPPEKTPKDIRPKPRAEGLSLEAEAEADGTRSLTAETTPEIPLTIEQMNAALIMQEIDTSQLELLFVRSTALASPAIVQFVTALCEVSRQELGATPPRIFSLQKVVEVADHNMNRIRLIWSKIWAVLREHFAEVGALWWGVGPR